MTHCGRLKGGCVSITELPRLWTEAEVAQQLGVNAETLARERRRGNLTASRVGRKIRYTAAQIAAYLEMTACASTSRPATASGKSAGPTIMDARSANLAALEIGKSPTGSSQRTS
jgi:excisionase family DNA binding protein